MPSACLPAARQAAAPGPSSWATPSSHARSLPLHPPPPPFRSAGDEFRAILSEFATIPQEHLDAVARQKAPEPLAV